MIGFKKHLLPIAMCMGVLPICVCVLHVYSSQVGQKRVSDPLGLTIVSCQVGIEPGSSARGASALTTEPSHKLLHDSFLRIYQACLFSYHELCVFTTIIPWLYYSRASLSDQSKTSNPHVAQDGFKRLSLNFPNPLTCMPWLLAGPFLLFKSPCFPVPGPLPVTPVLSICVSVS